MCDCLKTIETKTMEVVKGQKEGEVTDGKMLNTHFPFVKNSLKNRVTYNEFQFFFAPIKKDGSIGKPKKQTVSISHSYCPFCGEKHSKN
jgi:hypothetical protein